MNKRKTYEIPVGLKEAQALRSVAEFAVRASADSRSVVAVGGRTGSSAWVFRIAQVLRLDYTRLKQRTRVAAPSRTPRTQSLAFVELMAPATTQNCECVIEVEGPRGHIRIEWKSSVAPDLTSLSRMLWEPGA